MAHTEWLRTFVCACQSGSISEAARVRHISQPAATSHIRSLEAAAGAPLFVRHRDGVVATAAGQRLYAEVADPLDRLGSVLAGLDGGALTISRTPVRVGASPEIFAGLVASHLAGVSTQVTAIFGTDDELHARLMRDEVDLVVTATQIARRDVVSEIVGWHHYTLVTSANAPGPLPATIDQLARALRGAPWVSFSRDLPTTRRFWKRHLGRPFDAQVRLVAPDLRVVLSAVEAGLGTSLLPAMVCELALRRGSVVELFPVRDLIKPRPLWASARVTMADTADIARLLSSLSEERA